MQLTPFILLAGVLGAAAHPSGHAHLHRSAHAKRDTPSYVKNVHVKPIPKPTTTSHAPQPTTTSAAAAAATAASGASQSNSYVAFCGSSASKAKRVTYEQVMYTGNTGTSDGCPWNSNIMTVSNSIADKYKYVQKFTNVASETYQVVCGNKIGADGKLTGMFKVAGQQQLIFSLAPGETKTVVADENTQGVCAWAPNEVPVVQENGQYAGVWGEFNFGDKSNGGWSGADCSALVAQAYNLPVPGCRMSHGGVDSTILPGGQATNAYVKGMEAVDGVGLNIVPGSVVIEVQVGYSG
ncbi:83ec3ef6-5e7c-468d-8771-a0fbf45b9833 [Thermothielavioides terrestris]|uniref:Allergen Asp f 4 n=2 Tax=Thermothielavioides terrestris TaxID=2587410 RepID=G2RCI8_THETT|nr:uncharacterized protein THITE_2171393 [Thermothielavioides terrestris NRRL 8126]AEO70623.1 hypothetical protein THITE_2171393 [Thermothielavioides terrestris NRRL 8126]SPQ18446.1 83ec3ef6-5e7c-468d-8771-a0fbf45b9833 [Thermothielavioides terrestris]